MVSSPPVSPHFTRETCTSLWTSGWEPGLSILGSIHVRSLQVTATPRQVQAQGVDMAAVCACPLVHARGEWLKKAFLCDNEDSPRLPEASGGNPRQNHRYLKTH